jgi:putative ABC transport system substrate-binding protein
MRRRDFIAGLGSTAAWPMAARAQQRAVPVVGFLNSGSPDGYAPYVARFRQGLKETGYVEGQNVAIEFRWADGQYDRVPAMAAELLRRQVTVIVANTPGLMAVKATTTTIPIVFTAAADPVSIGRVTSPKGERPSDLPVQQATKFELVINLKTAKALGLTIPETLLATADDVIQ